jgi:hypothetical protein
MQTAQNSDQDDYINCGGKIITVEKFRILQQKNEEIIKLDCALDNLLALADVSENGAKNDADFSPKSTPEKIKKSGHLRKNTLKTAKSQLGSTSRRIRAELYSHNTKKTSVFSNNIENVNIEALEGENNTLTNTLKNLINTSIRFKDLDSFQRLLVCNVCLNSQVSETLQSIPFVFVIPNSLQDTTDRLLKDKIQKALKKTLGGGVQFWLTNEYALKKGNIHKHFNGEILINSDSVNSFVETLTALYTTTQDKKGVNFALRLRSAKRNEIINNSGLPYAILNWVSYSYKETSFNRYHQIAKLKGRESATLAYISQPLTKAARHFYNENVYKQ